MKVWPSKLQRKVKRVRLFERSRERKLGLPPGTPVHIGAHREFKPWASLLSYQAEKCTEIEKLEPRDFERSLLPGQINWLNIEGVHDVGFVQTVSQPLGLHPLTMEDVVNTSSRPQFESYPGYYFFSLQMLYLNGERQLTQEHVSLILKDNTVVSFQESPGDVFGRIRERIRSQPTMLASRGADYLVYMLIDSIVDGYYQVVDNLGERIDNLEEQMHAGPRDVHLAKIYELRREILFLRKNIMPVRDLLSKVHVDGRVFQTNTKIYLKDLTDHIVQVTESLSLSMEMTAVLLDTYHSMQNSRMNAIMKTLTMISTVFLPLNFIAGIYGMNFRHMPELELHYAYPVVLGVMMLVAIGMTAAFVRKGWLLEGRFRNVWNIFDDNDAS